MRNALFFVYSIFNAWVLQKISKATETLTTLTAHFSYAIFAVIDKDRLSHLRSVVEQQHLIDELKVFSMINEVQEDAVNNGEWNEDHENQLNWYGNILYNQHDWEAEEVQRYLTDVVERASLQMSQD